VPQLALKLFAIGDVLLDGYKVLDGALVVAYRGDQGLLPVQLAILLAVVKFAPPLAAG